MRARTPSLVLALGLVACTAAPPGDRRDADTDDADSAAADTGHADTAGGDDTADPPEVVGGSALRWGHAGGVVDGAFDLSLESPVAGASVVYTLDCSDPLGSSTGAVATWAGPLPITTTTVVRAAALVDGVPVGPSETRTFVFLDQVPDQQAPAGWPTAWSTDFGSGGWTAPHYTLSAEVAAADPAALQAALAALPVVSLVLDPADLWGPTGLYDHAWEETADWERPAALALYSGDAGDFEVNAGVRIYGGASRRPDRSPKKTLRVVFREAYGPGRLDFPVYGAAAPTAFDGLVLRAGYNHTWVHWDPTQRSRSQYLRDVHARQVQRDLGWHAPRGRPVHLYLDGLYWGVYDVAERADAHFFADRSEDGGEVDEAWDVLNSGEAIDGDTVDWEETLALAAADDGSEAALAALEARVDADALIDYMLLNFWAGNDDWPHHNWYAARARSAAGRWRFVSWDAEHTLKDPAADVTGADDAGSPAQVFRAFARHPAFVARLAARAEVLLAADGPLGPAAAVARYEALATRVEPALLAESARWGTYRRDVYCWQTGPCDLYGVETHWRPEHDRLVDTYLPGRAETVQSQLAARGWAAGR